jgi:hypothetical protein
MKVDAKSVLYAAVGAPVVAARKVGETAGAVSTKLTEQASGYTKTLEKKVGDWAVEGEKVIGRIGDQKVVEDITARVDLDQAKDQVSKLRDQLEEMLATWRTSFRPEDAKAPAATPAAKTAATPKKPVAKKPVAKKPAAKATASKSTKASAAKTAKSSAAKTSTAKTSTAAKADKPS